MESLGILKDVYHRFIDTTPRRGGVVSKVVSEAQETEAVPEAQEAETVTEAQEAISEA
jgi:DNA-binding winged helix-turn-helix (wHTH) protein